MNIAVTGGAGFIGSHIVEKLVERGDNVIVIDNLVTGKKDNLKKVWNKIDFFELDIRNFETVETSFFQSSLVIRVPSILLNPPKDNICTYTSPPPFLILLISPKHPITSSSA